MPCELAVGRGATCRKNSHRGAGVRIMMERHNAQKILSEQEFGFNKSRLRKVAV